MSLLVIGTVPVDIGRVFSGPVTSPGPGRLAVGGSELPGCQGTAALLLAAVAVTTHLGIEPPIALLGGDVGRGEGTRAVYDLLEETVARHEPDVVEFHYLQPVMALMKRAVARLTRDGMAEMRLVADAGGMYAARASGVGGAFELMTPDIGEVGFLADESASHPAYVSRYLFGVEGFDALELAQTAQRIGAASRVLLVKGSTDYIVEDGELVATVTEPSVPYLEAIGGTGDTLAGLVAVLMSAGLDTVDAATKAARVNRLGAELLGAKPFHTPGDLARHFPEALALLGL